MSYDKDEILSLKSKQKVDCEFSLQEEGEELSEEIDCFYI
jgi:hypothetical protein